MALVFVESAEDELSRQALAFADALGEPAQAVMLEGVYAPSSWAQAIVSRIDEAAPRLVIGPGSERGNEVLAHVAARLDQPMAAHCVSLTLGEPATVTRIRSSPMNRETSIGPGCPP